MIRLIIGDLKMHLGVQNKENTVLPSDILFLRERSEDTKKF